MVRVRASFAGGLFLLVAVVRCTSFGTDGPEPSGAATPAIDGATVLPDGAIDRPDGRTPLDDAAAGADASCSADLMNDGKNCGACGVSCFGAACAGGYCETTPIAKLKLTDGAFAVTRDALFIATEERIAGITGVVRLPKDVASTAFTSRVDAGLSSTGAADLAVMKGNLFAARLGSGGAPTGVLRYGGGTAWSAVHGLSTSWLFPAGDDVLLGTSGSRITAFVMDKDSLLASGSLANDGPRFCGLAKVGSTFFASTNFQGISAGKPVGAALVTTRLDLVDLDSQRAPTLSASDGASGVMIAQFRSLTGNEAECTATPGTAAVYRLLDTTPPSMSRLYTIADEMVRSVVVDGPATYVVTVSGAGFGNATLKRCDDAGVCRILFAAQASAPVRERSLVKEGALLFFRIEDEIRLVDARRK